VIQAACRLHTRPAYLPQLGCADTMVRFFMVGIAVLWGAGLGCNRVAPSTGSSPSDAATFAPSIPAAYDAGVSGDLSVVVASDDFDAVIRGITKSLDGVEIHQWQLTADDERKNAQLAWLAKDFGTPAFTKASGLDEAVLLAKTESGPLHVGLLQVHFPSCKLLRAASGGVEKAKRLNFLLPVLTTFRTHERNHSLLFVLSETPLQSGVEAIYKDLSAVVGAATPCEESPNLEKTHR
jgi:hypothetical protein